MGLANPIDSHTVMIVIVRYWHRAVSFISGLPASTAGNQG